MVKFYPYLFRILTALSLLFFSVGVSAQTENCGFGAAHTFRHVLRPNIPISSHLNGFLEYTPPGYNPAGTKLYPLILYFHGVGEAGSGSATDLCKIFSLNSNGTNNPFDIPLPERIELGQLPTVTLNGNNYDFIVLSPQFSSYNFPSNYPSAADVDAMINYAVLNYKVDVSRIYLTGMSAGGNMVIEYAASSIANATRAAAIAMASFCSRVGQYPNGPANIANADLAFWEVHCINDDFSDGVPPDGDCHDSISTNWVNLINSQANPPSPLAKKTTLPTGPYPCNGGFTHNTWNTLYDPAFVIDGRNIYNWFIQFDRSAALPANLKNYVAVLRGGKVYVEWTTTSENNTDRFVLERGNANNQYQELATVAAAGTSASDKKYALIDDQPLRGLNLYRLALVNKDGRKEYFDVKRVSLPTAQAGYVTIPGPVKGSMSVYVNVDKAQNVNISIHDINGKNVYRINKLMAPGLTENRINVTTLPAGTYFVKVEGVYFKETKKIVVN